MTNPLKVSLENIIPLTEARDHFSQIVNEVQKDKLYVLTKGGKPAVAIVDVKYLEHITGGEINKDNVVEEVKKVPPEKLGLAPMIEHEKPATPPIPSAPINPKPFTPPPSAKPTSPPPPKPVGFSTPQPQPQPQPQSFKSASTPPTTPPPAAKPLQVPPIQKNPQNSPPPQSEEKIDIQFSQETPKENLNKTKDEYTSPDDKNSPAQYDAKQDEPEDMSID